MKTLLVVLSLFLFTSIANAKIKSETHKIKITASGHYRCYTGGKKGVVDEKTKQPCDDKHHKERFFGEVFPLKIKSEPAKGRKLNLVGSWFKKYKLKGREFTFLVQLIKSNEDPKHPYYLALLAKDNQEGSRETRTYIRLKDMDQLIPISVQATSLGKKEEIDVSLFVEAG